MNVSVTHNEARASKLSQTRGGKTMVFKINKMFFLLLMVFNFNVLMLRIVVKKLAH